MEIPIGGAVTAKGRHMFTGIIDHIGHIESIEEIASGLRLGIDTQFKDLTIGESIAIDGACLTVVDHQSSHFFTELSTETLSKTIAKQYQTGQAVNLERALRLGERLGGHFVSGHVDQIATVEAIIPQDEFHQYRIGDLPEKAQGLLIDKGSITINGVSLTLNTINTTSIEVMLIPHTWEQTNLSQLSINSTVNIEFDLLAKIILKQTRGLRHEASF